LIIENGTDASMMHASGFGGEHYTLSGVLSEWFFDELSNWFLPSFFVRPITIRRSGYYGVVKFHILDDF